LETAHRLSDDLRARARILRLRIDSALVLREIFPIRFSFHSNYTDYTHTRESNYIFAEADRQAVQKERNKVANEQRLRFCR